MTAFRSRNSAERLRRHHARRKGLLLSCALGTSVALTLPAAAYAQQGAFRGTITNGDGPGFTRTPITDQTETIQINGPSAVINWQPDAGGDFLPAGNTATFQGNGDFAVLNRISPIGVPIQFNGRVVSQIQNPATGITSRGGTVLFSAPSGIIIGANAVFDVGSLVLTTLEVNSLGGGDAYGNFDFIAPDGSIGFFNSDIAGGITTDAGSQIRANSVPGSYVALIAPNIDHAGSILVNGSAALLGAGATATLNLTPGQFRISVDSGPGNSVTTRSGSSITAEASPGSNVALVAPSVTHGGAIRVDGQAALVAGETVEISLSAANGLFNIAVPIGVRSGAPAGGLTSTGSIGGPASTGAGDPHAIYLVTVPRPDEATTLLLDGAVGFDAPVSASVQNGQIVISAGYNITDGASDATTDFQNIDGSFGFPGESDIIIDGGTFTSDVNARAYGTISLNGGTFTSMTANATRDFYAYTNNAPIDFSGDLTVNVGGYTYGYGSSAGYAGLGARGGNNFHVGGDLSITSLAQTSFSDLGAFRQGGGIAINASEGGNFIVDGAARLDASATGGETGYGDGEGGAGGNVRLGANAGSGIQIGGDLTILASGTGADTNGSYDYANAGRGGGGRTNIDANGGAISIGGNLLVDVSGTAGSQQSNYEGGTYGQAGYGGSIDIRGQDGGTIAVTGTGQLLASGRGGDIGNNNPDAAGGSGYGGYVGITGAGGAVTLTGATNIDVRGLGGAGPNGGYGGGGYASASAYEGGNVVFSGAIGIDASGLGGAGTTGAGGDGRGGYAGLDVYGGSITFDTAQLRADGTGGNGVTRGGDGLGGAGGGDGGPQGVYIESRNGGSIAGRFMTASAAGVGGAASAGDGGEGDGGRIQVHAFNADSSSTINLAGASSLDVSGRGGAGGNGGAGGDASGGDAAAIGESLNSTFSSNGMTIDATATGGAGSVNPSGAGGRGGDATGGTVLVGLVSGYGSAGADAGSVIFTAPIVADVSARGGAGGGDGGDGTAGSASLVAEGGTMTTGDITFTAIGTGGNAGAGGAGGDGTGGDASATFTIRTAGLPSDGGGQAFQPQAASDGVSAILGNFTATTSGIAGTGATDGASRYGTLGISSSSSIVEFSNIALSVLGDGAVDPADTTTISVNDSQFDITNGFSLTTPGLAAIELVNSSSTDNGTFDVAASGVTFTADTSFFQVQGDASFDLAGAVLGQPLSGNDFALTADNSTVDFQGGLGIDVSATGSSAVGGTISISATNNSLFSSGVSMWNAVGTGTGASGVGGGGTITVTAGAGSTVDLGGGSINANGVGGNGGGGPGGGGVGGAILITALTGGTIAAADLGIVANGLGGTGFGGGGGIGGNVQVLASGGTLDFGGTVSLGARGIGGAGAPGAGGAGAGTLALVSVSDGGSLTFDQLAIDASGIGGSGSTGGQGLGGFSPDAPQEIGSGAFLLVSGGSATGNGVTLAAAGTGGAGLGDVGGDGLGGTAQIAGLGEDVPSNIDIGTASIDLSGFGGAGGEGSEGDGAAGGNALGGDARVFSSNGTLQIDTLAVTAVARGGQGGDGVTTPAGGGAGGAGGSAQGGSVGIGASAATGNAIFGSASLNATATGGNGGAPGGAATGGAGGDAQAGIAQLGVSGGAVDAGNVQLIADGVGGAAGAGGIGGIGAGGFAGTDLTDGADVTVDTLGASVSGLGGGGAAAGAALFGEIAINVISSNLALGNATLTAFGDAPSERFSDPSRIALDGGQITLTGTLAFNVPGELDVTGAGTLGGSGNALFSADRISFSDGSTISLGAIDASAQGDIVVDSGATVRAASNINFYAGGTAEIAGRVAGDGINISSTDIDIAESGFIGDSGTGTVNLNVNPGSGQAVIGGDEEGPGYTLDNGEAQRIQAGVLRISVPVTGTSATRDPDVLIRDLTLNGTPSPNGGGAVGTLEIDVGGGVEGPDSVGIRPAAAPQPGEGIARIEGNVLLANAGADNRILIEADGLLTMVTPDGSLRVQDASGNPTGLIGLASNNIWVGAQGLLDQLAADPDFAGRDDALLANNGAEEPRGYIEGGDVQMFVRDTLFVQNTGNADTFGGITVTGDLTVTPSGQTPLDVRAFGRRLNADGTFQTNNDFFRTVAFEQGYGGFTDTAEFNLCVIASGVCPGDVVQPDDTIQPPTSDQIQQPVEGTGDETTQPVVNVNAEFDENSVFDSNELIEEPVTSGGDAGLWTDNRHCDENGEHCTDGDGTPANTTQSSGNPGGGSNGN